MSEGLFSGIRIMVNQVNQTNHGQNLAQM